MTLTVFQRGRRQQFEARRGRREARGRKLEGLEVIALMGSRQEEEPVSN